MNPERVVRIAGASGGWGDSPRAVPQLLGARPDYLVMDYLAEVTMALLARARIKDPAGGYVPDFADFLVPHLRKLGGTKVVTNAGGTNPAGCAAALRRLSDGAGVRLRIAVVEGDDVLPHVAALTGHIEASGTGEVPFDRLLSANAYLGAFPIAAALAGGADVVITGRCADSALALGILIAEFGWSPGDHDLLAAGSLLGHILECGPQATGGIFTDWRTVPGWEDIGYPFADCRADGSFVIGKPEGTGGVVTPPAVAEQILYEVGDPRAYLLPDVVVDLSQVSVIEAGADRVAVAGVRGHAPTPHHKVTATYRDGYRLAGLLPIVGTEAAAKAERTAEALILRGRRMFVEAGLSGFTATHAEALGSEASYGRAARRSDTREVVLRLVLDHPDRKALDLFGREIASMGLGGAPGTTGFLGGRAKATPLIRNLSFLVPKRLLPAPRVTIDDDPAFEVPVHAGEDYAVPPISQPEVPPPPGRLIEVPLARVAHARSGDKGNDSNIALFARTPQLVPALRREATAARVAAWFAEELEGEARRYEAPGLHAFNFVLTHSLAGGGMASPRIDPQGKAFGQRLLEMPVGIEADLLDALPGGAAEPTARKGRREK